MSRCFGAALGYGMVQENDSFPCMGPDHLAKVAVAARLIVFLVHPHR